MLGDRYTRFSAAIATCALVGRTMNDHRTPWSTADTGRLKMLGAFAGRDFKPFEFLQSKPPNVVTRWGTNPNVGNLEWGSESEFLTELLR